MLHNRAQLESTRSAIDMLRRQQGVSSASKSAKKKSGGNDRGVAAQSTAPASARPSSEPQQSPDVYGSAPSAATEASVFGIHIQGGNRVGKWGTLQDAWVCESKVSLESIPKVKPCVRPVRTLGLALDGERGGAGG